MVYFDFVDRLDKAGEPASQRATFPLVEAKSVENDADFLHRYRGRRSALSDDKGSGPTLDFFSVECKRERLLVTGD